MKRLFALFLLVAPCLAEEGVTSAPAGVSELPSVEAKPKVPGLGEDSRPDFSGALPEDSPSVPQLRPPAAAPAKPSDKDWAAQGIQQKNEEAKKAEQEQLKMAEQKSREDKEKLEKEKKSKGVAVGPSGKPALSQSAMSGTGSAEAKNLPAVTGMDGVKPRAMGSGDGRVSPGFDSFSGPSASGPLGQDYQSGAKPIMPRTDSADGRMQLPPQAPEAPSGAYKKISQDPYSTPAGYGEKKTPPPPPSKPSVIAPNPSTGDPKRVIDDSKAGYSPYDSTRKVPDPRSQRRF